MSGDGIRDQRSERSDRGSYPGRGHKPRPVEKVRIPDPGMIQCYSCRSAINGSMRRARRAGT
jgi:hypothetical protein